ncbi:MAG: GNAT family N-acetyltransferase [Bacteroidales bacterium]|nr:GNAT family N-acetyltransferase [Bacteroidales bacterium]
MEQNQLTLKALPGTSLSSGQLKLYAFTSQEEPVGCVELYDYDPVNRRAAVGIVVSNEYRHRGYGQAMLAALTQFCMVNTSLHQVYADIAAVNETSIHIFQKAGYILCATMHDWVIRADHYVDTLRYQLILER